MVIKSLIKILILVIICLNYNSPKLLEAREPQAFSAEEMASIFPDEWPDEWVEMVIGMTGFVKGRNREFSKGSASAKLHKGIDEESGSLDYFLMLQVKDAINKEKAWQGINKAIKKFTAYKPIMYNDNKGFLAKEKGYANLIYLSDRFIINATLSGQKEIPGRPIKFIEPVLQSLNLKKITKVKVEKEKSEIVYPGIPPEIQKEFQKYMETQMPEEYKEHLEKMKEMFPDYSDMYEEEEEKEEKEKGGEEEGPFGPEYTGEWNPLRIRPIMDYVEENEEIEEVKKLDANGDGYMDDWRNIIDISDSERAKKGYDLDVSDDFGLRIDPITGEESFHNGIDIECSRGDPIRAMADGVVTEVVDGYKPGDKNAPKNGNYVRIKHKNGSRSVYLHLLNTNVKKGYHVKAGEEIGKDNNTGRSTGDHLHLSYYEYKNGKREYKDPREHFH